MSDQDTPYFLHFELDRTIPTVSSRLFQHHLILPFLLDRIIPQHLWVNIQTLEHHQHREPLETD